MRPVEAPWTLERFIKGDDRQDEAHAFGGARPVPMSGGSYEHRILGFTITALLRERHCRAFGTLLIKQERFGALVPTREAGRCITRAVTEGVMAPPGIGVELALSDLRRNHVLTAGLLTSGKATVLANKGHSRRQAE